MMINLLRRGWVLSLLVATMLVMPCIASEASPPARTADEWAAIATQNLKDGNRAGAIEALRAAVAIDPAHPSAGLLITTLHQSGQVEEAWAIGSRYERDGAPRNPRALFRFGWLLAFIGEVDRADTLFAKLIELDRSGIYEAWGNGERAHLARARGNARAAVAFMERAVAARPADMISRVGRAQMMIEAGDARAAIPLLEAELKADPAARAYGGTPAALILGWALRRLGDDTGAERWLAPLEKTLFPATGDAGLRQLGMEPMQTARQLAWLSLQRRRDEALALAARTPTIPLYGAPDPRDGMLATLAGEPHFEALLTRSRDQIDAERKRVGLGQLVRPGKP